MSPKYKFTKNEIITKNQIKQNTSVTNMQMSPKRVWHLKVNVTKTQMLPNCKFHQNTNVTKTHMSPNWKNHQNINVIKTQILPKQKHNQNTNVTKRKISQNALIFKKKKKIKSKMKNCVRPEKAAEKAVHKYKSGFEEIFACSQFFPLKCLSSIIRLSQPPSLTSKWEGDPIYALHCSGQSCL